MQGGGRGKIGKSGNAYVDSSVVRIGEGVVRNASLHSNVVGELRIVKSIAKSELKSDFSSVHTPTISDFILINFSNAFSEN